jgi:hypothetical protein
VIDRNLRSLLFLLAAIVMLSTSALGQLGPPDPQGPFAEALERRRAEMDLRTVPTKLRERMIRNFSDPRIVKQMNEDFLRIQAIRADMVKVFAEGSTLTPEQLQSDGRDIRRRATRLRSLLALSEEHKDVEVPRAIPLTVDSLNARAFQLCLEISRFTGNPMFKTKGVITVNTAKEATETLDLLISLAAMLEKESDSLADQ